MKLFEEELVNEKNLIDMYNKINSDILNNELPVGVKYKKEDDKRYGTPEYNYIGLSISSAKGHIGLAVSRFNYSIDRVQPVNIKLSKLYDYTPYDEAITGNAANSIMGILLHEMAHLLVSQRHTISEYKAIGKYEGGHGPKFKSVVKELQDKLTANGIKLIIPPSESTDIEYHPNAVKINPTYIFKVSDIGFYVTNEYAGIYYQSKLDTDNKPYELYKTTDPNIQKLTVTKMIPVRSGYSLKSDTINKILLSDKTEKITEITASDKTKKKQEAANVADVYVIGFNDKRNILSGVFVKAKVYDKHKDEIIKIISNFYGVSTESFLIWHTTDPKINEAKIKYTNKPTDPKIYYLSSSSAYRTIINSDLTRTIQ